MAKRFLLTVTVMLLLVGLLSANAGVIRKGNMRVETPRAPVDTTAPAQPSATQPSQPTVVPVVPQAGESIDWQVLAGGGSDMSGGTYAVSGTIGQPIVGLVSGGTNEVNQGYWQVFGGCCVGTRGNINLAGIIDLSDLSYLIDYLTTLPTPTLPCPDAANVDGKGIIDLTDLSWLILYLTSLPTPTLPSCP